MTDLFTSRFNEVLTAENINQTKLAEYLGISKQCISDYKSGKSFPTIHTLKRICEYLEISADFLLGLSEQM